MKTITLPLFAVLAFVLTISTKINAQTSCPVIVTGSYYVSTDVSNPCIRTVSFNFYNPTNGAKRINVKVTVDNIQVINDCVDASNQKDVIRSYTSAPFTVCDLSKLTVAITPYTGSNCVDVACSSTIFAIGGAPLPVLFSSFNASRNGSSVLLKWETATEINNTGFTIERNTNGKWEEVAFVASQAIGGNSSDELTYQYTDFNSNKGLTQYRLKQTDIDGAFKYSDIRAVMGSAQDAKTIVFPNPSSNGKVTLVFEDASARSISITDMSGKTVKQWGSYSASTLQVENLTPGIYTMRSVSRENGNISIEKIAISGR
jgi:hypothetical protein